MILFVITGCGTAMGHGASDGATRLVVAFAFGMAIMVLAYSIGHHSGGHLNCAVTFSLVLGGQVPWYQGISNLIGQLLGSVIGAVVLLLMFPCEADHTTNLGTNIIGDQYSIVGVLIAEAFGTFLLCFTVWETAVTPEASCGKNACIAIGFSVFLAHLVLLPIDGCSINPTRSFGPAIVSLFRGCENYTEGGLEDLWVMWVGPLIGAALATGAQYIFAPKKDRYELAEPSTETQYDASDASRNLERTVRKLEQVQLQGLEQIDQKLDEHLGAMKKQSRKNRGVAQCAVLGCGP